MTADRLVNVPDQEVAPPGRRALGCAGLWLLLAGASTVWTVAVVVLGLNPVFMVSFLGVGEGPGGQPALSGIAIPIVLALATLVPIGLLGMLGGFRLLRGRSSRMALVAAVAWVFVGTVVWAVGGTPDTLVISGAMLSLIAYGTLRRQRRHPWHHQVAPES